MQYREMRSTGDKLSVLGYGCMRLPSKGMKINEEKAKEQIYRAIDEGVNYIDTAWPYHMGNSEPFVGKILEGEKRNKVKLATKLPQWMVKKSQDMDNLLNSQLEKLRTDHIDYYLVHALGGMDRWNKLKEIGITDFLEKARKAGKIINIGFSFHGKQDDFLQIVDDYDQWDFTQIQFNILDEQTQAGRKGMEHAYSKGLGIIVMEPLRGGNLTDPIPPDIQKIWKRAPIKRTPADWALRWVWDNPEVTLLLSGMNQDEHVEENIRVACEALPNNLSKPEKEILSDIADKYRDIMEINCTGCNYCMPCPSGVDIPGSFEKFNSAVMFHKPLMYRGTYLMQQAGLFGADSSLASNCTECGKCERHCPQQIPIRADLKKVKRKFEGLFTKPIIWMLEKGLIGMSKKELNQEETKKDES